jgi:hypothetical protein
MAENEEFGYVYLRWGLMPYFRKTGQKIKFICRRAATHFLAFCFFGAVHAPKRAI